MSRPDLRLVSDEELTELLAHPLSAPAAKGGGGGGSFDSMETRVAQLETDMREVKANTRTISDTLLRIEGKIQKPEAFYVLQKSSINYDWQDLKQDFVPKILESVTQAPF